MPIIILSFVAIAAMRVIQKVCSKAVSNSVQSGEVFFRYGAFYQFIAALFSLITLAITGFHGLNVPTIICAFVSALLFAVDLFTGIEALKGSSLIVATMFGLGGMIVSCILSIFLFNEPMSLFQTLGLGLFFLGVYLLSPSNEAANKRISAKTYIMLITNLIANGFVMVAQKYFSALCEGSLTFGKYAASSYSVAMYSFLTFILNAIIMAAGVIVLTLNRNQSPEKTTQNTIAVFGLTRLQLICGTLLAFAVFVINYVVTELGKTVPSVILFPVSSAISIGLSALIGWAMYKEKLTAKGFIGLFIGLIGIVIIGVLTPAVVAEWFPMN